MEKRGYEVKNYVLREVEPFKMIFNLPVRLLNKFFKMGTTYFYVRTPMHFYLSNLYSCFIRIISDKQDVMVVQGFSYPLHNGKNKQILLGDWPSEYLFEEFLKRQPSGFERKSIDRENEVIEAADAVITLFPNVREYMLRKYKNKNIYCFGNVVNIDDDVVIPTDIQKRKIKSQKLLFIGQTFYLQGALELIAAAKSLRESGVNCEVDIIGINARLIGAEYPWLTVHGYLDKEKPEEKRKYYELLANARLFVNTTSGWSGFQALLEAMYFYTPILVRPNESLSSYFPNLKQLAYVLEDREVSLDSLLLESFSDSENYQAMSELSHNSVKSSTWSHFTENMIQLIR
jgi:glycosyltransferase involved in cell wall biosynthesis